MSNIIDRHPFVFSAPDTCKCGDRESSIVHLIESKDCALCKRQGMNATVLGAPDGKHYCLGHNPKTAADILDTMAQTFRERNAVYGNNFELVGKTMEALFPNGIQLQTEDDHKLFHLFSLVIVKLTRFVVSDLKHKDSVHDAAVYLAMIESIMKEEK